MLLFDYLQSLIPDLTPECTKVHLARFNGTDNPLDVYVAGKFEDWQSRQTRKNFSRKYVVSLIQSGNSQRWLYAGTFTVICCSGLPVPSSEWDGDFYTYELERVVAADKYEGRMYVQSQYKERQGYPRGETLALDLCVEEISPVRLSFADFPGYRELVLNRDQLGYLIRHNLQTWRTALETVKGIYLLTDTDSGKLYVGKASGAGGFWSRWSCYFDTVHGGNKGLIEELGEASVDRLQGIRFSILEVMDPNATDKEISLRESHWKEVLLSRLVGYNRN